MKVSERCPRCHGMITVVVKPAAHAERIIAAFRQVHADTCPTPEPRPEKKKAAA